MQKQIVITIKTRQLKRQIIQHTIYILYLMKGLKKDILRHIYI